MGKAFTGVDIGGQSVKLVSCQDGMPQKFVIEALPEGLVADGRIVSHDAMADFIKGIIKGAGMPKDAALALSGDESLTRRLELPVMSEKELLINLPYEFRDYISQGKDRYYYDYALYEISQPEEEGATQSMDLMACAVQKQTITEYEAMFRRAGLRLRCALPASAALQNMVSRVNSEESCCIIDFAHASTKLTFFAKGRLDVTRSIELGGIDIDRAIAESFDVDAFVARGYKQSDYNNAQTCQAAMDTYESIAVEIARALNFYGFNNPDLELTNVYYIGGGASLVSLVNTVRENINVALKPVEALFANGSVSPDLLPISFTAIGATLRAGE